jgi:hypothetical protein
MRTAKPGGPLPPYSPVDMTTGEWRAEGSSLDGDLIFKVEFTIKDADMIVSRDFDKIEL